jgi:acyl carrier protein
MLREDFVGEQQEEQRLWLLGRKDLPRYVRHRRGWPQVDIYAVELDAHAAHLPLLESVLSDQEREAIQRLRDPSQRRRVAISRGLLRHLVGVYLGSDAVRVPLERDQLGKPALSASAGEAPLFASCSRSNSAAVFAVGNVDPLGVDIEGVTGDKFRAELADEALSRREQRLFALVPAHERPRWLAQAWVRKEAILKGLGCGLELHPATIEAAGPFGVPDRSGWLLHERPWKQCAIALAVRAAACSVRWAELLPARTSTARMETGHAAIQPYFIEAPTNRGYEVVIDDVRTVIGGTLQLGTRSQAMNAATPLLGAIPELDSMAVVNVLTALEEHFGIIIGDDEIQAATFETLGTLAAFIEQKLDKRSSIQPA